MKRGALAATVVLLIAAAAAFGGAAALGWARVGFQAPLRGSVPVRVTGTDLVPVLGPLALLALASVAAVLATGGWARRLLGVLLVGAAVPAGLGVARVGDQSRLVAAAVSAGSPADRAVPDGTVALLAAGPVLAAAGVVLLAGGGAVLVLCGHRMPRMGSRYRAPAARTSGPQELWERIDAGEDPTAQGDPR